MGIRCYTYPNMTRRAKFIYGSIEYVSFALILTLVALGSGRFYEIVSWVPIWEEVLFWQAVLLIIIISIKAERARIAKFRDEQINYETEGQFLTMYDRSPIPYLTIDRSGVVLKFNQAAVLLLEASIESLERVNLFSFVDKLDEGDISILLGKVQNGMTVDEQEVCLHTKKGNERWVLFSTYEFQSADERLVSMVDVTQQKIVDRAKSEFVALATHQLRTPVSAIRWNVELLERNLGESKSEDQARYLKKVHRNVLRMIALINDFLSVSKLETGSFATSLEPIPLAEFVVTVNDEYTESITDKKLRIETHVEPSDFIFNTDRNLFHIILSNLVSNAVKYSTQDGYLRVLCEVQAGELIVQVINLGIGIPEKEIDNLFTKFYRASNAQSHHTEGTGLGLYVVKQSVEKLGGTVNVRSEVNGETNFTIRLPI